MFLYPPGGSGVPDGTNEVDIEVSKWGNENGKNLLYNCFSTTNGITRGSNYDMKLNGSYTTHRFQWTPDHVSYESMHGHQNDSTFQFVNWTTPSDIAHLIPSMELTVHINLWLFEGRPPSDGKPVEVVIKRFRHHWGKSDFVWVAGRVLMLCFLGDSEIGNYVANERYDYRLKINRGLSVIFLFIISLERSNIMKSELIFLEFNLHSF